MLLHLARRHVCGLAGCVVYGMHKVIIEDENGDNMIPLNRVAGETIKMF